MNGSDGGKEPSVAKYKSTRVFRGNLNYVDFYNRFVQETFEPLPTHSFHQSRITHIGEVYYSTELRKQYNERETPEIQNEETDEVTSGPLQLLDKTPGTLWTSTEKEIFFDALSKYSIHRLDLIRLRLPKKSELEIMVYYEVLKRGLEELKQNNLRQYRYKRNGITHKINMPHHTRRLMRYGEMPIAHEMSEYFIKFEDVQSDLISLKERRKENDNNIKNKKQFMKYTTIRQKTSSSEENSATNVNHHERQDNGDGQCHDQDADGSAGADIEGEGSSKDSNQIITEHTSPSNLKRKRVRPHKYTPKRIKTTYDSDDQISEHQTLFNLGPLSELTKKFYTYNNIIDTDCYHQSAKFTLSFGYESLVLMEELVQQMTRKIVAHCISHQTMLRSLGTSIAASKDPLGEVIIKSRDVVSSVSKLGYKHPDSYFNKDKYWENLADRLKLDIDGETIVESGYSYLRSFPYNETGQFYDQRREVYISPFMMVKEDDRNTENIDESEPKGEDYSAIPHISSLKRFRAEIHTQPQANDIYEMVEEKLQIVEDRALEAADRNESLVHETALLTYLMTNDEENVKSKIYNEEEAELVVQMWDVELKEAELEAAHDRQDEEQERQRTKDNNGDEEYVSAVHFETGPSELLSPTANIETDPDVTIRIEDGFGASASESESEDDYFEDSDLEAIELTENIVENYKYEFATY
ncbi:uncharacterized protein RJT20DRAFT_57257 [Scheffersomyces xylosifermentans]|uniref:uncharacterized protein n=1 Tax=Scheffersomyces xylosifermentans TaxID=1304137 RepID=UPI00315D4334